MSKIKLLTNKLLQLKLESVFEFVFMLKDPKKRLITFSLK